MNTIRYIFKNELTRSLIISEFAAILSFVLGMLLLIGSMDKILSSFLLCMPICFTFIYKRKKNVGKVLISVFFPLTLFSLPSIEKCSRLILICSLTLAALFLAAYLTVFRKDKVLCRIKCIVLIFTAVMLPAFTAMNFFKISGLPIYTIPEQSSPQICRTKEMTETEWENLNTLRRIELLSEIAENEAAEFDIGVPEIRLCILPDINGVYKAKRNIIQVDIMYLNSASAQKAISLIAHELYHSYEFKLISGNIPLDAAQSEKAAIYKYEFENYINGVTGDYYSYYSQECEADARAFGEKISEKYILKGE